MKAFYIGLSICILAIGCTQAPNSIATNKMPETQMGNGVGNGGGGWVCRTPDGTIQWSEVVDLFEAQSEFGLTLENYSGFSTEEIVERVKARVESLNIPFNQFGDLPKYLDRLNYLKPTPKQILYVDTPLKVINDALYIMIPRADTCPGGIIHYEQVVNYHDDGTIEVQKEVFESLSNLSKAALIFHEAVYANRRGVGGFGDKNSVISRRFVGIAFSTTSNSDFLGEIENLLFILNVPLYLGDYEIELKKINSDGYFEPFKDTSLTLTADYYLDDNTNIPRVKFPSKTDANGVAKINIPQREDYVVVTRPTIDTQLDIPFSNDLGPFGWGTVIGPAKGEPQSKYECEDIILKEAEQGNPGKISIICVDR